MKKTRVLLVFLLIFTAVFSAGCSGKKDEGFFSKSALTSAEAEEAKEFLTDKWKGLSVQWNTYLKTTGKELTEKDFRPEESYKAFCLTGNYDELGDRTLTESLTYPVIYYLKVSPRLYLIAQRNAAEDTLHYVSARFLSEEEERHGVQAVKKLIAESFGGKEYDYLYVAVPDPELIYLKDAEGQGWIMSVHRYNDQYGGLEKYRFYPEEEALKSITDYIKGKKEEFNQMLEKSTVRIETGGIVYEYCPYSPAGSQDLPEGWAQAGMVTREMIVKEVPVNLVGFDPVGCPYYVNPEDPSVIYLYAQGEYFPHQYILFSKQK